MKPFPNIEGRLYPPELAGQRYPAGIRIYAESELPRPYGVGSIVKTFKKYPTTGAALPAMGYGEAQMRELGETINHTPADLVIVATPIDLRRVARIDKPGQRVRYELQEIGQPTLADLLKAKFGDKRQTVWKIYHLVPAEYFHSLPTSEPYLPREFAQDGFIHCTKEPEVLLRVANQFYKETPGEMLVLVIDEAKVTAEIKYESPEPGGHLFPHIYGPLNREAIVEVRVVERKPDGSFDSL